MKIGSLMIKEKSWRSFSIPRHPSFTPFFSSFSNHNIQTMGVTLWRKLHLKTFVYSNIIPAGVFQVNPKLPNKSAVTLKMRFIFVLLEIPEVASVVMNGYLWMPYCKPSRKFLKTLPSRLSISFPCSRVNPWILPLFSWQFFWWKI